MPEPAFRLKVRIGDMEVELGGEREEVLETLEDLDLIIDKVSKAFKISWNFSSLFSEDGSAVNVNRVYH